MIQIYFFSILCNALAGFVFLADDLEPDGASGGFFKNDGFRLCLAAVCAATGVLKLLSVNPGNVPVIGDLLPAAGSLAAGAGLFYDFYRSRATQTAFEPRAGRFFHAHKRLIGGGLVAAAVLHLLFPTALFL